uniref:Uncharacterized protein n=1 Tax=Anopheles christyi TaxID=43041 RepID=A0A182KI14_9DIPT
KEVFSDQWQDQLEHIAVSRISALVCCHVAHSCLRDGSTQKQISSKVTTQCAVSCVVVSGYYYCCWWCGS